MKLIDPVRVALLLVLCPLPSGAAETEDPGTAERTIEAGEGGMDAKAASVPDPAGVLAGGLVVGLGASSALRRDRVQREHHVHHVPASPELPDVSPQVNANGAQIARNRDDIATLREALNGLVPGYDADDVLRFAPDHTVRLRGARLVGLGEGEIGPDSREGINGAQLFATHKRIGSLEHAAQYAKVGADDLSRPALAAHLGSAYGSDARAEGNGSTALGAYTWAHGTNSVAIGRGAYVRQHAADGFALGARAMVSAENGLAIGASTQVREDGYNSVAIGYGSVATQRMEVSVGGQGMRRRIVHVEPGAAPDDVVTVRQLNRLAGLLGAGEITADGQVPGRHYTVLGVRHDTVAGALGELDQGLRGTQQALETATSALHQRVDDLGGATVSHEQAAVAEVEGTATVARAAGAIPATLPRREPSPAVADLPIDHRAVDTAVNRANAYTDQAVSGVERRLGERVERLDRRLNRMAAMGGAQAAMAMNTAGLPTWNRLGAGIGHADGESALAVGYQRVLDRRAATTVSLNGAFSSGGERTVAMGFGVGW
ncbi:YadA-like family protein [Stenotrophomonas sp. PS02289]|uniref:YadA-like family protein n=1 Tax=Stenotrophomonas sp. PS02289 TaxID=2991422 RepID=UPI00249A7681|nr:YadA-like family protein [Stenotrophomonas sp. PS02289]